MMSSELTLEELHVLDAAGDVPARLLEPSTGHVSVLLPWADFEWLGDVLPNPPDAARRIDPRTKRSYALVASSDYERIKPLFEEDPITAEERAQQLREFGLRAGWDDPEMDAFEEYRKPS
jgi:hypothetical protein